MIIFIEGPDNAGKNELYNQLVAFFQNKNCKKCVVFYDTHPDGWELNHKNMVEAQAKVLMAMDIAHRCKDVSMIVNNGPVSLVADAFKLNDINVIKEASLSFAREQYQNVSVVSVMSQNASKDDTDMYRQISSRHMTVISDAGKGNKYRLFPYKGDDAARKLFNNDILALINN